MQRLRLSCSVLSSAMHIKEAILTVRKAGENDQEFVRLKLNDIIVSSVTDTVQAADDAIAENVTLSFARSRSSISAKDLMAPLSRYRR